MDAPRNVPDQNNEGGHQPTGLPIQVDKGQPKDASDPKPRQTLWLTAGILPPAAGNRPKETLTIERFHPSWRH
ncbi:uncharacterized protein N7529_000954 [Penicillium soppii]|uniref:uncharacterized protein n=1 Tax=Penicillium soppii TaxID=69789 RepID=UPI002549A63D|nr:uncharacterized protein N7529_000954 [Penicillium soppii]KAJ5882282.1 hypothetical protein N7529_000954 [Penicillium soppii]